MRSVLSGLRLSISTRLALWFGLSFLLLLSVFVIFLYAGFHVGLHRDFQRQLQSDLARAINLVRMTGDAATLRVDGPLTAGSYDVSGTGGTYVRLLSQEGNALQRSANFSDDAFVPRIPSEDKQATVGHTWKGVPARTVYTPLRGANDVPVAWLEVTRLESALHNELHRLEWLLAIGVLLGAAVAFGAGYLIARRALRPVVRITEASRRIQAEDLDRRVPADFGVRDELTDLAETLNALLDRLSASFKRERRFRADAAHEMFTPLSAIQSEIDVTLRKDRSAAEYEGALDAVRVHAKRLNAIVDGLLELSRAEALDSSRVPPTDASAIVSQVVDRNRRRAEDRHVTIRKSVEDSLLVRIEPGDLQSIVSNLLDNAIKYTPDGGIVTVELAGDANEVRFKVTDTGAGFTSAERRHLFDRFFRTNGATKSSAEGSGLGLSIVKAITEAYGGRVDAQSEGEGQGSTFTLTIPAR